jgi:hypothetical protein
MKSNLKELSLIIKMAMARNACMAYSYLANVRDEAGGRQKFTPEEADKELKESNQKMSLSIKRADGNATM